MFPDSKDQDSMTCAKKIKIEILKHAQQEYLSYESVKSTVQNQT